jgi:hypothetical protein
MPMKYRRLNFCLDTAPPFPARSWTPHSFTASVAGADPLTYGTLHTLRSPRQRHRSEKSGSVHRRRNASGSPRRGTNPTCRTRSSPALSPLSRGNPSRRNSLSPLQHRIGVGENSLGGSSNLSSMIVTVSWSFTFSTGFSPCATAAGAGRGSWCSGLSPSS